MALATSAWRDSFGRSCFIQTSNAPTNGDSCSRRWASRSAAVHPLISRSWAKIVSIWRTASTASGAGGAVTEALCWAHARRKFFELADLARAGRGPPAPLAVEAVRQIDAIFAHERAINGQTAADRLAHRREHAAALVGAFEVWMKHERPKLSRHAEVARAMDYLLKRWPAFTRFLDDGRICLTNNAAERALRGVALGRKSWLFVGSDRGGLRAASMYTLIGTAKLNDIDPQAWLADVLGRIANHPLQRLPELLPWNWRPPAVAASRNAA